MVVNRIQLSGSAVAGTVLPKPASVAVASALTQVVVASDTIAMSASEASVQGSALGAGTVAGGTIVVSSVSNARGFGQAVDAVDAGLGLTGLEVSRFQAVVAASDAPVGSMAAEGQGYLAGQTIWSGTQADGWPIKRERDADITADSVLEEPVAELLSSRNGRASRAEAQNHPFERVMVARAGLSGARSSSGSGAAVPAGPMSRLGDLLLVGAFSGFGARRLAARSGLSSGARSSKPSLDGDTKAPPMP